MKDNQKIQPHVLEAYQIIKKLGSGAYGHVWKAKDKKTGAIVAVKKIFDAFQHSTDAQRTFRQISILKQLKHDKIIKVHQVLDAFNSQDIYLVFQYMESDLYHLVYEGKLQSVHIKFILYQVLLGLHYLHTSNLIHRDLKPSNILVNSDCSAKICDFGLVRYLGNNYQKSCALTQGVATRWYRAPQILLGSNDYDTQADMWSVGCILAEILLKNPFFPGSCTTNQLERILQFTGQPSFLDLKSIKAQLSEVMISQVCNGKIKKKADLLSKIEDKVAVELIQKLLEFNPNKRLTAAEALKHKYFKQFYNSHDLNVKAENIFLEVEEDIKLEPSSYLNLIRQKFIYKNKAPRNDSFNKQRKKVEESPKSFSDLKKQKSSKKTLENSNSKQRLRTLQQWSDSEKNSRTTPGNVTNLFKQLCKGQSLGKKQMRSGSKQNVPAATNSIKKDQKQKGPDNFQSLSTANSNLKKFGEEKKVGSFIGLRKTSKVNQK